MENVEEFKKIVAENLVKYRKSSNLTQLELAEKLNYSDKAVSKWERGESIPDAWVLKEIADLYSITVDDLLTKRAEPKKMPFSIRKAFKNRHALIALLSGGTAWLVACVVFVVLAILGHTDIAYLSFIYAIPVSSVVCLVFSLLWFRKWISGIFATLIIWGTFLALFLTFNTANLWLIFIIAIPLQILTILWFFLIKENTKIKWHLKRFRLVKDEKDGDNKNNN